MTYRILITGSRTWTDDGVIWDALTDAIERAQVLGHREFVVIHGGAKGADTHAAAFCEDMAAHLENAGQALHEERHPADWAAACTNRCRTAHRRRRPDGSTYCPKAGPVRNQHMVDLGADVLLAFIRSGSSGATDCVRRAQRAGIDVRRWEA